MNDILFFYLLIGVIVSSYVYNEISNLGLTGDEMLLHFKPETREYFYNHPNLYMAAVIVSLLVIIVIWPYVLYEIIRDNDEGNNRFNFQSQ